MQKLKEYTTEAILAKVQADKDATIDEKIEEAEKIKVSNEAFAICDLINQLIKKIEHARISSITR
jgi:hypothetical protein